MITISEKNALLFIKNLKALLDIKGAKLRGLTTHSNSGKPDRYEYELSLPRLGHLRIVFYNKSDAVCYSIFTRFNRPILAKRFGGNEYSGKCNFHSDNLTDCYFQFEDFINMVTKVDKDELIPIDCT